MSLIVFGALGYALRAHRHSNKNAQRHWKVCGLPQCEVSYRKLPHRERMRTSNALLYMVIQRDLPRAAQEIAWTKPG